MPDANHYDILQLDRAATPEQIKQAYRRLVKQFHPDCNPDLASTDRIAAINVAYGILSDPRQRAAYDLGLRYGATDSPGDHASATAQRRSSTTTHPRSPRPRREADADLELWLRRVHTPVDRAIREIARSLKSAVNALSADPYDDELMAEFERYLERTTAALDRAKAALQSMPNPRSTAGAAAHLYYSLSHLGDGLDELAYFPLNYDETRLHDGQEFFRTAERLRREAKDAISNLGR
jgi:molecular chaperone DnaJ